jgi:hypothetical protein
MVDMPEHQRLSIRVWDDGTLQKLKANALRIDMGTEGDELARNLDLRIQELLGQPHGSKLNQEILIPERMISLETVQPDEDTLQEGQGQQEDPGLIKRGLSWAKDQLGQGAQVQKKPSNARIWLRVHWRPVSYSTPAAPLATNAYPQPYLNVPHQRLAHAWSPLVTSLQAPRGANGVVSGTPQARHSAEGLRRKKAGSDAGSATSDSEEEEPQPPGGWPTHVMRVGINFVERLLVAEDDNVTRFFVTCEATPSVNHDGVNVTDSVESVTTQKNKEAGRTCCSY